MIVADSSALIELLLPTGNAGTVAARLLDSGEPLAAPHLVDVETAHVLRRYARLGVIDNMQGRKAIDDLADLPIQRYPHEVLLPRVWELQHNLTAYDAVYVALAEVLDAPLVTRDRRLARAAGHGAEIELV
ncbi:MAG: type II toxin-antitoxin system VapC family toxin [Rhodospirillaceae bacterium]|nr:type II toxin-antitoxin system VapC family toxin [Rhodospirillaceae bacterium]